MPSEEIALQHSPSAFAYLTLPTPAPSHPAPLSVSGHRPSTPSLLHLLAAGWVLLGHWRYSTITTAIGETGPGVRKVTARFVEVIAITSLAGLRTRSEER